MTEFINWDFRKLHASPNTVTLFGVPHSVFTPLWTDPPLLRLMSGLG